MNSRKLCGIPQDVNDVSIASASTTCVANWKVTQTLGLPGVRLQMPKVPGRCWWSVWCCMEIGGLIPVDVTKVG